MKEPHKKLVKKVIIILDKLLNETESLTTEEMKKVEQAMFHMKELQ